MESIAALGLDSLGKLDILALAILAMAVLRGLAIGAIREAFSLAAIAATCVAVRFGSAPVAEWLRGEPFFLSEFSAPLVAGVAVAVVTLLGVGLVGRALRLTAHAVGLGLFDRVAGGLLGGAEGALIVALLLLLAGATLGRDTPALAESKAFAVYEDARRLAHQATPQAPPVASPPRRARP